MKSVWEESSQLKSPCTMLSQDNVTLLQWKHVCHGREQVFFLHFLQCKWCCANGIMVSGPLFIYFSFAFFRKREKSVSSRHPHGIRYWSRGLILTLTAAFILDNHGYLWSSLYLTIVRFYERVKQILGVLILSFPTHKRTQHGNYFQNLARNQLALF